MKRRLHDAVPMLALAAAMAAPGALAQSAGQWTVKAGVGEITPKVRSGDVSAPALPGSKAAIDADIRPVVSVVYGLSDNLSAELDLGLPYTHHINGAGAIAGTGRLGSVKLLPPTAFIQYRFFEPTAVLRPYLGLGATYAYFADATGSGQLTAITDIGGPPVTFSIKNKLAATLQAGVAWNIGARWFADLAYSRTALKTRATFSTGQTLDITLDPQSVSLGAGYSF